MRKPLLIAGLVLFGISFLLPAVGTSTADLFSTKGILGFQCAYTCLILPFADNNLLKDPVHVLPILISGLINPLFIAWLLFRSSERVRWLPAVISAMILVTWYVLWENKVVPNVGHVAWIAGMVLSFFAVRSEDRHV